MSFTKKIMIVLGSLFIVLQFIQPVHNKSGQVLQNNFASIYIVPDTVQMILKNTCYDCHSNNTNYPWYANTQPVAWIMASHIKEGKDKLNFSEFASYTTRRQISKLKEILNQINDDEMPLFSYTVLHKNARLSKEQKSLIMNSMNKIIDSLSIKN